MSKPGNLETAVENVVKKNDIDFLIMGTQGATGAKEVFLGSNTVKVLKHIKNIPILTVPTGHNFQNLTQVIFATDYSSAYKKSVLEPILELSKITTIKNYIKMCLEKDSPVKNINSVTYRLS